MLIPSIVIFLTLGIISIQLDCSSRPVNQCNTVHEIIWAGMIVGSVGMFALLRSWALYSENVMKKRLLHDKVTTISDDDKNTFNTLWANHLLKEWNNPEDDKSLQEFIMYMARTYSFDCTNFQLVDKERNLVHMRIPRI